MAVTVGHCLTLEPKRIWIKSYIAKTAVVGVLVW